MNLHDLSTILLAVSILAKSLGFSIRPTDGDLVQAYLKTYPSGLDSIPKPVRREMHGFFVHYDTILKQTCVFHMCNSDVFSFNPD